MSDRLVSALWSASPWIAVALALLTAHLLGVDLLDERPVSATARGVVSALRRAEARVVARVGPRVYAFAQGFGIVVAIVLYWSWHAHQMARCERGDPDGCLTTLGPAGQHH